MISRHDIALSRRTMLRGSAAVALGGLAAACGSPASGSAAGSLTLYSGQHEQTTQSLVNQFEQQAGVKVSVRYNDEDAFADEIIAERGHPIADVFLTENSPALMFLQDKGLLAKVDAATLAKTPAQYNSPGGDWIGVSGRVSVLIWNPSLISQADLPQHAIQLSDAKYRGKLAFAAGETDFQPIVTSVARTYGDAAAATWLNGIKSNSAQHVYPDNETIADEVNRGAVAFGVVNQYYWYRMKAELGASNMHSQISHFAAGDPGYVVNVSGCAILQSSKNKAAAQKFLAYLVSKSGQQVIADSISYEYPLDDGVTTTAPETPFSQLQPAPISIAELGDGSAAISLLQKAGLL